MNRVNPLGHSPELGIGLLFVAVVALGAGDVREDLSVTVQAGGKPVAGATVCVGTAADPDRDGLGKADAFGRVSFQGLPADRLVVTAHFGSLGASMGLDPGQEAVRMVLEPYSGVTCDGGTLSRVVVSPRPIDDPLVGKTAQPSFRSPRIRDTDLPREHLRHEPRAPIDPHPPQYCFGALGMQCGDGQSGLPAAALCLNGTCRINAGSWEHDQCCQEHPEGMACMAGPLDYARDHGGVCLAEWNKALSRLRERFVWTRQINFAESNSTGRVVHRDYCAPGGTVVHRDDAEYCCSHSVRNVESKDVSALLRQGVALSMILARMCQ